MNIEIPSIERAEDILMDNGHDHDDAREILAAICCALLDAELYDREGIPQAVNVQEGSVMDVREFITRKFNIYWNKSHDVQWIADKFDLKHYHFKEGEISKVLYTGNKRSISCGVEMTKSDEVFKYFTFTFKQLQELFNAGIISFSM